MNDTDPPIRKTPEEARAGATPHVARVALIGGMILAALGFWVVWLLGAH